MDALPQQPVELEHDAVVHHDRGVRLVCLERPEHAPVDTIGPASRLSFEGPALSLDRPAVGREPRQRCPERVGRRCFTDASVRRDAGGHRVFGRAAAGVLRLDDREQRTVDARDVEGVDQPERSASRPPFPWYHRAPSSPGRSAETSAPAEAGVP